ncbi:hypothetical protein V1514DRAFT_338394 [Lipomyces japonicus]|uniref:uncharacterized protein n=1 Tax=Lipomyces japonicus TaxID=56871 RepID=UPI0034CEBBA9
MNCLTEVGKIAISLFIAYVVKAPVAQMTTTATGLQVVTATTTGPIRPITGNDEPRVTETGLQVYGHGPDMTTDLTVVYYDMPQCQCPATYDVRTTNLIVLTETGRSKETGLSVIVISMRMIPGQHWEPQRTLTIHHVGSAAAIATAEADADADQIAGVCCCVQRFQKYAIGNGSMFTRRVVKPGFGHGLAIVLSVARRMRPLGRRCGD